MFKIWGKYKGGKKELIDSFDCKIECMRCLNEYKMAYGVGWEIWTNIKDHIFN